MVNFIVCEDNKIILQKNVDIINKTMFGNDVDYKILSFSNYTDQLKETIRSDIENKVYILDIELEDKSGVDIASEIRDIDLESLIIISTLHTDYLPYLLKSKLMIYDFVSKFDNYEENLSKIILKIIKNLKDKKYLEIRFKGKNKRILLDEIVYIKYNKEKGRTTIKTKQNQYETYKAFNLLISNLNNNFTKKNRNYYFNKNNANYYKKNSFSCKNKKERSVKK